MNFSDYLTRLDGVRICPDCGAHLDPSEICDCREKPADEPCDTCYRWDECEGIDKPNCPLCRR